MHFPVIDPPHTPIRPVSGSYSESFGYRIVRRRGSDDFLMIATAGGEGIVRWQDGERRLPRGSVLLVAPGVPHDYATSSPGAPWEFRWVHFLPRAEWRDWMCWTPLARGMVAAELDEPSLGRVLAAFDRVLEAPAHGLPHAHAFAMNALETAILEIDSAVGSRDGRALDPRLRRAMVGLQRNCSGDVTLGRLADLAGMSPSRFSHLFRMQVGVPPMQYVEIVRLERARQLLQLGPASVAQVAAAVGYRNPCHFSTRFRERFGLSPMRYRAANSQSDGSRG